MSTNNWLELAEQKREQIISQLSELVSINSVEDLSTADPEHDVPYGVGPRRALDAMLSMGSHSGFRTQDYHGRVGRIECGSGKEIMGILAHLDTVPAGEGWLTDPFEAKIIDGRIHGRGVIDDKGPAVAALAAMEIASSLVREPKRQVHLILGCNEETGMNCMHYYVDHVEDLPDFGVTPDNVFPVVFGEKGILRVGVKGRIDSAITKMVSGTRPNVVPNLATAEVRLNGKNFDAVKDSFDAYLAEHSLQGEISSNGSTASVEVRGVSCHSQQPSDGINAATHLFDWVGKTLDDAAGSLLAKLMLNWDGSGFGTAFYGKYMKELTMSLGIVELADGQMSLTLDIRYPNDITDDEIVARMQHALDDAGSDWALTKMSNTPALFMDPESDYVKMLTDCYREVTGDTESPLATTGGGTYARLFKNHVAFGPIFPNEILPEGVGSLHQANEAIKVDQLVQTCAIYAKLLTEMMQG